MPPKSAPPASPSVTDTSSGEPSKSAPPASPSVTDTSPGEEEDEEQLSPPSIRPSATATAAKKPAAAASASSSGEEDSSSGEEGDEEESGSGERNQPPPPPTKIPAADDSDYDSDYDPNPPTAPRHYARVADPAVKPLASKPFQRKWRDEDEIASLQGLIDYNAMFGRLPFTATGMGPYHDFIHDSLQGDFNNAQLFDKLRRLKKKYDSSRLPSSSKQYELSHKLWDEPMAESERPEKRQRVNDETVERIDVSEDEDGDVLKGPYPYLMTVLSEMGVEGSIVTEERIDVSEDEDGDVLKGPYPYLCMTYYIMQKTYKQKYYIKQQAF